MATAASSPSSGSIAAPSPLSIARTATGYCLRVTGRGTSQSSPAAQAFVKQAMNDPSTTLVVDLTRCDYLDSTFLGFLVSVHRACGKPQEGEAPRFSLVADPERWAKLLAPTGLQRVFLSSPEVPPIQGEWLPLSPPPGTDIDWGQHVLDCHRQLADIDGPNREKFARIAQQLAGELAGKKNKPGTL